MNCFVPQTIVYWSVWYSPHCILLLISNFLNIPVSQKKMLKEKKMMKKKKKKEKKKKKKQSQRRTQRLVIHPPMVLAWNTQHPLLNLLLSLLVLTRTLLTLLPQLLQKHLSIHLFLQQHISPISIWPISIPPQFHQ